MKKFVILLSLMLVLTFMVSPTNATIGIELEDDLSECTIGVNHSFKTTHNGPVLWKVRDLELDVCQIVKFYPGTNYDFIAIVHWLGEEHNAVGLGLNQAGIGLGNSAVSVKDFDSNNFAFMYHILENYGSLDQIREYIESGVGQNMHGASGCFPFIDNFGNASMFEVDGSGDTFWEYNTMAPARESQGLLGFVVRANEFHKQELGMDDTSIKWRYLTGAENTLGLIAANEFNEQSVVQSDSGGEYRLIRQSDKPWSISRNWSQSAMVIRGAAPGEDPALATMWAVLGNPSFSIAVPTWAEVSVIPDPIATCDMYNAVYTLYSNKQIKEEWVQAVVLPAEAHLFDMVNERILPKWHEVGPPAVEEMTRIEEQMAEDAYSVVNYMATTLESNLGPTIDFEAQHLSNLAYTFNPSAADEDGSIVSFLWNFGDGTTSEEDVPVHDFLSTGVYLVSVTVTDDDGVSTTAWRYLTIADE
jgi:hypothetical protein